jgi:hypothetical protein
MWIKRLWTFVALRTDADLITIILSHERAMQRNAREFTDASEASLSASA